MIEKILKRLGKQLDKAGIPYMVIGGQAVLLYGIPRLTLDIDITLGIDTDNFLSIKKICEKLRLKMLHENPEKFAAATKVLPVEEQKYKIRIDFIFSFTPYEKQAMERTKSVSLSGHPIKFASCEDLIIHKMFAGRAIDDEDVKNILIKNKDRIDLKYIEKWLLEFSKLSDYANVVQKFKLLLSQI